jgi:hypothetical protein
VTARRLVRTLTALVLLLMATDARADWLFTPFIGSTFGTKTSYVTVETGAPASKHVTWGGSAALLSRGIFGVEGDFGYTSRFFERSKRAGIITGSNVFTLSGSVIAAVPLSVTHESLRPYLTGGYGMIHAGSQDLVNVIPVDANLSAMNVGGGAIGLISPRTGFRFEIRQFRSLHNGVTLSGVDSARLSFWRATIGVIIRFPN